MPTPLERRYVRADFTPDEAWPYAVDLAAHEDVADALAARVRAAGVATWPVLPERMFAEFLVKVWACAPAHAPDGYRFAQIDGRPSLLYVHDGGPDVWGLWQLLALAALRVIKGDEKATRADRWYRALCFAVPRERAPDALRLRDTTAATFIGPRLLADRLARLPQSHLLYSGRR